MIPRGLASAGPAMHRSTFVNGNVLDEIPASPAKLRKYYLLYYFWQGRARAGRNNFRTLMRRSQSRSSPRNRAASGRIVQENKNGHLARNAIKLRYSL
jgi:hypothetical protein